MRNLLMRLNYNLSRFMMGRYGVDALSKTAILLSIALVFLSSLLSFPLLYFIGTLLSLWALLRIFSKNFEKRRKELERYNRTVQKITKKIKFYKELHQMKKTHRLYKCKNCKTILRVPKGVGKIKITCAKCKTTMIKKA